MNDGWLYFAVKQMAALQNILNIVYTLHSKKQLMMFGRKEISTKSTLIRKYNLFLTKLLNMLNLASKFTFLLILLEKKFLLLMLTQLNKYV